MAWPLVVRCNEVAPAVRPRVQAPLLIFSSQPHGAIRFSPWLSGNRRKQSAQCAALDGRARSRPPLPPMRDNRMRPRLTRRTSARASPCVQESRSSGSSWLGVTMLRSWIVLRVPRRILSQS